MNINKILVFGGTALIAILIIENMIMPMQAYVFISISKGWVLSLVSVIIGIGIGFGIKGIMNGPKDFEDDSAF